MRNKLMKALLCLTALICGPKVWADGIKLTTDVNNPVYYRISNEYAAANAPGTKKYLAYNADQGENTVTVTTEVGDAALFYFMKGRYQEIPSSFTAGDNGYNVTDAVGVDIYTSTSNGKILRTATGNWIDPATGNDGRQWYIAPGTATYAKTGITYNGYILAYFKGDKTPNVDCVAIHQQNTNLRYGDQISHKGISNYAGQIWTLEEVSETPEQIEAAKLKAAKENLQSSINNAKKYILGAGFGQYSYNYTGALPLLTTDDSAPILYRLVNTRRQAQSNACYITEAGTLSTSASDAVQVCFKGSIEDGLATVKVYNTNGKALASTGNSKPSSSATSNLTWDNEGANIYIKARKSLQAGNYNGVVIAFNNPWHDDLSGDAAGGDVWYVGSKDPVVWAYSGNYDGSIFTLEIVDPAQAIVPFDSKTLIASAESLLATSNVRADLEAKTAEVEDMLAHLSFNMPKAGQFMQLKSHQYSTFVSASSETGRFPMVSDADASCIFYYDGTHLVNYTTGMVFSNTPVTLTQGDDCNYTAVLKESGSIEFTTSRKKHIGIYSIYTKGGSENAELLTKAAGNNLDGFSSWLEHEDADIDLVAVNALPVTIKSYGYASFSAPVDVEIPAGVEAYVGKVEGENLVMTAVEGKIPANTGVILKGTAGQTYNMAITEGAAVADNDLAATYYTKAAPANTYVLGNGSEGAGIYKFNGENVGGFKAYLESASAVKAMVFGGEETAIQSIMNSNENGKVYDLSGRRVEKAQKGIYIMNGKKVVK